MKRLHWQVLLKLSQVSSYSVQLAWTAFGVIVCLLECLKILREKGGMSVANLSKCFLFGIDIRVSFHHPGAGDIWILVTDTRLEKKSHFMLQTQILLAIGVTKSVFKCSKLEYCCSFKNFL